MPYLIRNPSSRPPSDLHAEGPNLAGIPAVVHCWRWWWSGGVNGGPSNGEHLRRAVVLADEHGAAFDALFQRVHFSPLLLI